MHDYIIRKSTHLWEMEVQITDLKLKVILLVKIKVKLKYLGSNIHQL